MAKSTTEVEDKTAEKSTNPDADVEQNSTAPAPSQPTQTLKIEDSNAVACYANFCRVSSTPEELILDLGLNPNPYTQGEVTVPISQRTIMNHYTAKRLLSALSMALQRHEQSFGVLETDVRRRVRTT